MLKKIIVCLRDLFMCQDKLPPLTRTVDLSSTASGDFADLIVAGTPAPTSAERPESRKPSVVRTDDAVSRAADQFLATVEGNTPSPDPALPRSVHQPKGTATQKKTKRPAEVLDDEQDAKRLKTSHENIREQSAPLPGHPGYFVDPLTEEQRKEVRKKQDAHGNVSESNVVEGRRVTKPKQNYASASQKKK